MKEKKDGTADAGHVSLVLAVVSHLRKNKQAVPEDLAEMSDEVLMGMLPEIEYSPIEVYEYRNPDGGLPPHHRGAMTFKRFRKSGRRKGKSL